MTKTQESIGPAARGQTMQFQYPTSGDCGTRSQMVEVNQNLAILNKRVERIEAASWMIVILLAWMIVILLAMMALRIFSRKESK